MWSSVSDLLAWMFASSPSPGFLFAGRGGEDSLPTLGYGQELPGSEGEFSSSDASLFLPHACLLQTPREDGPVCSQAGQPAEQRLAQISAPEALGAAECFSADPRGAAWPGRKNQASGDKHLWF